LENLDSFIVFLEIKAAIIAMWSHRTHSKGVRSLQKRWVARLIQFGLKYGTEPGVAGYVNAGNWRCQTLYPAIASEAEQTVKRGDSMHQIQEVKQSLDQTLQSNQ